MLTEDQTNQLLSSFWIQANQTDNTPFNYEAIGHSYSLTVLSSRLKVRIHWKKNILLKSMDIKSSQRHKVDIYLLSSHFGYQFCFIRELIGLLVIHFRTAISILAFVFKILIILTKLFYIFLDAAEFKQQ